MTLLRDISSDLEARKQRRRPMLLKARLKSGEKTTECVITDLSGDGFRAAMPSLDRIPRDVTVELDGQATWKAVCQWQRGMKAGFRFTQPG